MRFFDDDSVDRRLAATSAVAVLVGGDADDFACLDPVQLAQDFAAARRRRPSLEGPPAIDRALRGDRSIPKRVKRAAFERAGGFCEYCGVPVFDTAVIAESMLRAGITIQTNISSKPDLAVTRNAGGVAVLHQAKPDGTPSLNASLAPETEGAVLNSLARYDHVFPWSAGGLSELENVALCCKPCNSLKGKFLLSQLDVDEPSWFAPG